MEIDTDMHDGSPLGNGHVNAEVYANQAICTERTCPSFGSHWKCYPPRYNQCITYLKRSSRDFEDDSDSGLVELTLE